MSLSAAIDNTEVQGLNSGESSAQAASQVAPQLWNIVVDVMKDSGLDVDSEEAALLSALPEPVRMGASFARGEAESVDMGSNFSIVNPEQLAEGLQVKSGAVYIGDTKLDLQALVQMVLFEAAQESMQVVEDRLKDVQANNQAKADMRAEMADVRDGMDPEKPGSEGLELQTKQDQLANLADDGQLLMLGLQQGLQHMKAMMDGLDKAMETFNKMQQKIIA